jgi:choline transport protein
MYIYRTSLINTDQSQRYDAAAHLAEEIDRPAKYVPLAMVGSIVVNGCIGLIYCIVLLFSLGDLDDLLASPTGFPFIQLFLNASQSRAGATVLALIPTLVAVAASTAGLTSTSRTAWAFARDDAFPFSAFFAKVDGKTYVPVRMCVLVTVLQGLLGILYVVNTTAFNALLSMAILGMYASYALPVVFKLHNDCLAPANRLPVAWFNMGRAGRYVNVAALLWSFVAMLFSVFPTAQPVSAGNMNYAVVVFCGWMVFGGVYYAVCKRGRYTGPLDFEPVAAAAATSFVEGST